MNQRTAMIIAAGVTAFTLAAGGAVAVTTTVLAQANPAQANPAQTNMTRTNVTQTTAAQATVAQPAAASMADIAALSSDDAAQIALSLAPGAQMTAAPRLVNFEGTAAYEVTLDAGTVYVDANSGEVLYAAPAQARPGRGGEEHEHEEDEQEEHEHDAGFRGDL